MKYNLVLFAGGKGTRLGSVTKLQPKPMVDVNGIPLIQRVINLYEGLINKVIICSGYLSEQIEEFYKDKENIIVVNTGIGAGTAYRLKQVKHLIDGDNFFLAVSSATIISATVDAE